MIKVKKAFSLIEVIFVLVILGIVASISTQIIVQVYENYIIQKALYNTTTKTELVANQIVNRLSYVIEGTTITKNPNSPQPYTASNENVNWRRLTNIITDNNFTTVEWIGYDNDSFSAGVSPYWSGVANYETATRISFTSPASTFTTVDAIIGNLSDGRVKLDGTGTGGANGLPAIIFIEKANEYNSTLRYSPACMGIVDDSNITCISRVQMIDNTNLRFQNSVVKKIVTERYKLAWSAYALVPVDPNGDGLFDLYLHYNYQPWNGDDFRLRSDGTATPRSLLIRGVSVFKFTENGGVLQLKLCATENIGENFGISSCKEKAVIR